MSFDGAVEVRIEVRPRWPYRLSRRVGLDGLSRIRNGVLHRLLHAGDERLLGDIRALWKQALIVNRPGRPRDQIGADVASGLADLEAYGQMVLANPDFVGRVKAAASMNEADRASFFGGAAKGYTDYPALEAAAAA